MDDFRCSWLRRGWFAVALAVYAVTALPPRATADETIPSDLHGIGMAEEDQPGLIHPASSLPAPPPRYVPSAKELQPAKAPVAVNTPARRGVLPAIVRPRPTVSQSSAMSVYQGPAPTRVAHAERPATASQRPRSVLTAMAIDDLPDESSLPSDEEPSLAPDDVSSLADEMLRSDDEPLTLVAASDSGAKTSDDKPKADQGDEEKPTAEDPGTVVGSSLDLKPVWTNNGFELQSKNKDFKIHVGGRTQVDASFFDADDSVQYGAGGTGTIGDSINMRRARLRVDGTFYEVIDWAAEYDFVNTAAVATAADGVLPFPVPTDLWVTLTHLPVVGNFRVGNFKDPISFEHLTSSRWLNFLERSPGFDAIFGRFTNGFVPGAMFFNWNESERMTWALGAFKNNTNPFGFGVGGGEYMLEGRLTALPVFDADGRYLIHAGISGRHADLDQQQIRFISRGSIRSGPPGPINPVYANTGFIAGDTQDIVNVELASVWGPWQFSSEYSASFVTNATFPNVNGTFRGNVFFQQTYVEALYFLTGEHRAYNRKTGVFDRIVPHENFFCVKDEQGCGIFGRGAWQVGARYAFLDLNDSGISGGQLHDMTFGLNWFLNPNMKFQWNYNWTRRDAGGNTSDGDIHGLGMRMAMDF